LTIIFYNSLALLKYFDRSLACLSDTTSMKLKVNMALWWNGTGSGKSNNVKSNVT
jgi:hypothetical protein